MNKYQYTVEGVDYDVEIEDIEGNIAKVNVNGLAFEVELKQPLKPTPKVTRPVVTAPQAAAAAPVAAAPAAAGAIKAPLPGTVSDIKVQVGQQVNVGDTLLVLEAMKMQNNIEAEQAGKVTAILVKQGDTVMEGAPLLTIN